MATYKVIQDIEAEDKFLGPLTLKQFIFACSGAFFGWLSFVSVIRGFWPILIVLVPLMLAGFGLAFPWSKDQPTDVWLLAKFRFYFGEKKRIWDQDGMQELVTITAPKKIERVLTNSLSQHEVKSRLQALAETIDSRGWAVKNAGLPDSFGSYSDRLVAPNVAESVLAVNDMPDMFELGNDRVDAGLKQSSAAQRQRNVEKLNLIRAGESLDNIDKIMNTNFTPPSTSFSLPTNPVTDNAFRTAPLPHPASSTNDQIIPTAEEMALLEQLRAKTNASKNNLHDRSKVAESQQQAPNPAIMSLKDNNDLSIETLQREAAESGNDTNGEVVISLR